MYTNGTQHSSPFFPFFFSYKNRPRIAELEISVFIGQNIEEIVIFLYKENKIYCTKVLTCESYPFLGITDKINLPLAFYLCCTVPLFGARLSVLMWCA